MCQLLDKMAHLFFLKMEALRNEGVNLEVEIMNFKLKIIFIISITLASSVFNDSNYSIENIIINFELNIEVHFQCKFLIFWNFFW